MRYRLGLDIGANSIGWCAVCLDAESQPNGILAAGARVYPDGRNPKDGTSLAAARRAPRAMRRNRDRYLRRRRNLLNALIRFGLMPADAGARHLIASRDPYALRMQGLRERLVPHDLGRLLFHLNQHRGFKSNRKTDRGDNESGLIKDAAAATAAELLREGSATIGEWLAHRHAQKRPVRVRLAGSGKNKAYPFYPTREMVEAEFDAIWAVQAGWDPTLTIDKRDALRRIIFFQRPLKPVPVGRCWLEPAEFRAARALPTTQRFRIAQTLSHLRLASPGMPERTLTDQESDVLRVLLYKGRDLSFDRVRKMLKLPDEADFNSREDGLTGCATAARLGRKAAAGDAWHNLDLDAQDAAATIIEGAETDEQATDALMALGLDGTVAARLAGATLPDGHAALSAKAMRKMLPHLEAGRRYDEAVQLAGYAHHSDRRTGEVRSSLPYYGELLFERIGSGSGLPGDPLEQRFGRAPNPTVHVALNELRRVVNGVIERMGSPPAEIVVETLRDLGRSKKQREVEEKRIRENRAKNDLRRKMLGELGLPVNSTNLMRLRLWEEQAADPKDRVCPYTGKLITPVVALSAEVEEDHILPFALSLDDGAANRILVMREANRAKARRTPFEAFGHDSTWPAILERVKLLPENKRWRFQPDAMAKFSRDGDFLARHLTDSATIARWAKEYLEVLAPGRIWTVPGRLTSLLRHGLGLNSRSLLGKGGTSKDRTDHRHHAIDALVVALTDRGMLQRVTRAAKAAETRGERLMVALDPPWDGFVSEAGARLRSIVVSHKPDTGWQAALHNDTAYGPIAGATGREPNVVVRRPIGSFEDWTAAEAKSAVRDAALGEKIATTLTITDKTARRAALAALRHSGGFEVRRVRTTERLDSVQPIHDRNTGRVYKVVKRDGNHRSEIWRMPNGKLEMRLISTFAAARAAEAIRLGRLAPDLRPHPAAKLVMRLHKNDCVCLGTGEARQVMRVVKMSEGVIVLAAVHEGGSLKARDADRSDVFRYLYGSLKRMMETGARKVQITPDGRLRDPGPPR